MSSISRVLQFAAYTFDASMLEILATLMFSACICVISDSDRRNNIAETINRFKVNYMLLTPTTATLLRPADVPGLTTLILGGEAMTRKNVLDWAENVFLINAYGPTETAVAVSGNMGVKPNCSAANIGKSAWAYFWLVDPSNENRLASVGMVGEIWIEGPCLARGYLNNEKISNTVFVERAGWLDVHSDFNPNTSNVKCRFYKSGDLGRYNSDGSI